MSTWENIDETLSYNGLFTIILGARNVGKTWGAKRKIVRRFMKNGKKTIWVRRTITEARECVDSFFDGKDLQQFCGIDIYEKHTNPKGRVKRRGNKFYMKRGKKWVWFLKIMPLTKVKDMRSSDDVDCNFIVFDEFTTTPEKYRLYRGNECKDFIDLFITIMRHHGGRALLMGNKESVFNPILQYFKIPPIPTNFEGVRRYRSGTIVIKQRNSIVEQHTDYERQLKRLLMGTDYGDYMYEGKTKAQPKIRLEMQPKDALGYIQLYTRGVHLNVKTKNGIYYVGDKNDLTANVYCLEYSPTIPKARTLNKVEHRRRLRPLMLAIVDNRIKYSSYATYEQFQYIIKWLGMTSQAS